MSEDIPPKVGDWAVYLGPLGTWETRGALELWDGGRVWLPHVCGLLPNEVKLRYWGPQDRCEYLLIALQELQAQLEMTYKQAKAATDTAMESMINFMPKVP